MRSGVSLVRRCSGWLLVLVALLTMWVATHAQRGGRGGGGGGGATRIEVDLEYARIGTRPLKLDLYRAGNSTNPSPVVVWLHDGTAGRNPTPAAALNANGYVVASVEYRGLSEAKFPAQLHDVKAAIRWLRANAKERNLDPEHIGVWGHGVGGHLATMLGLTTDAKELEGDEGNLDQSSRVQGVVSFSAATSYAAGAGEKGNLLSYVSQNAVPILLVHGSADTEVLSTQSQKLISALKVAGADARFELQIGAPHDIGKLISMPVLQMVTRFFDQRLRGTAGSAALSDFPSLPGGVWVDPVALDLGGTEYKTYATPVRGPGTIASYRLYLPPDYASNMGRRYPVIYFTHGANVDSKRPITSGYVARIDAAIRSGVMPAVILVVIQGPNNAWWVDSPNGQLPVESVVIKDLIPHIDATYRTIPTRAARAIEGHSMGGFGALHLGFKYSDLFVAVTGNSSALLGAGANYGEEETPLALAGKFTEKLRQQNIRFLCGTADNLISGSRTLDARLTELNIPHQFIPVEGSPHNHDQLLAYMNFDPMEFYGKVFASFR